MSKISGISLETDERAELTIIDLARYGEFGNELEQLVTDNIKSQKDKAHCVLSKVIEICKIDSSSWMRFLENLESVDNGIFYYIDIIDIGEKERLLISGDNILSLLKKNERPILAFWGSYGEVVEKYEKEGKASPFLKRFIDFQPIEPKDNPYSPRAEELDLIIRTS